MAKVEAERNHTPNGRSTNDASSATWGKAIQPKARGASPRTAAGNGKLNGNVRGSIRRAASPRLSRGQRGRPSADVEQTADAISSMPPAATDAGQWVTAQDENSGHWYYHNTHTGESKWAVEVSGLGAENTGY